jgi:hypothetical protein
LDFKPCKGCSDGRKLCIEQSELVATRVAFLREIKQQISDILRIVINSILLYNFPRKSRAPPPPPAPGTLWKPLEGHKWWLFVNRTLRRISGPKRDEITRN